MIMFYPISRESADDKACVNKSVAKVLLNIC